MASDSFHYCSMTDVGLVAGAMSDSTAMSDHACCSVTDVGLVAGAMSDSTTMSAGTEVTHSEGHHPGHAGAK